MHFDRVSDSAVDREGNREDVLPRRVERQLTLCVATERGGAGVGGDCARHADASNAQTITARHTAIVRMIVTPYLVSVMPVL